MQTETAEDELFRLTIESFSINKRIATLMTKGTKVIQQEMSDEEATNLGLEKEE